MGDLLKVGDVVIRIKDNHPMEVVKDGEATLYLDNDKIEITDAQFYYEHGALGKSVDDDYLLERIERLEKDPESSILWRSIRKH